MHSLLCSDYMLIGTDTFPKLTQTYSTFSQLIIQVVGLRKKKKQYQSARYSLLGRETGTI